MTRRAIRTGSGPDGAHNIPSSDPPLVIGIGNSFRGDDGAGLAVVSRLREAAPGFVSVRECSGEGAALMACWAGCQTVILIDATHSGAAPGTVRRIEAHNQHLPTGFAGCSTHGFGVAEAIELSRAIDELPENLIVYGIEGERFDTGRELSPAVGNSVEQVARQILAEVSRLASPRSDSRAPY